ncbi:MAG: hypothetical protein GY811_29355 [Myxococcales bacterium]|nr:hypothetical protein [Myxococcales bacterium]
MNITLTIWRAAICIGLAFGTSACEPTVGAPDSGGNATLDGGGGSEDGGREDDSGLPDACDDLTADACEARDDCTLHDDGCRDSQNDECTDLDADQCAERDDCFVDETGIFPQCASNEAAECDVLDEALCIGRNDCAWLGDRCEADGATSPNCIPPTTPERLVLVEDGGSVVGRTTSAIAADDVDRDGCRDVVALVTSNGGTKLSLVVAWGDQTGEWSERWTQVLKEVNFPPGGIPWLTTRDSSSSVVDVGDWNSDGFLDVATASGVALGGLDRTMVWHPLPGDVVDSMPPPAAFVKLDTDDTVELLRGTAAGLERCTYNDGCNALVGAVGDFPVTDFVVADLDRDDRPDILAGRDMEENVAPDGTLLVKTWLWSSRTDWSTSVAIAGMHTLDLEVADVNQDGFPDVVSQIKEYVSDFPSDTEVWINKPGGLEKTQRMHNSHNHNDAMSVTDVDGDGCPDWLFIGVDIPFVDLRWGNCSTFGPDSPSLLIPSQTGIGIQFMDVTGDGTKVIVIRSWFEGGRSGLQFVPAPVRM